MAKGVYESAEGIESKPTAIPNIITPCLRDIFNLLFRLTNKYSNMDIEELNAARNKHRKKSVPTICPNSITSNMETNTMNAKAGPCPTS